MMKVLGLYKAFNALNSDDMEDLLELAMDYLRELPDDKILSESFAETIKTADELLTYMKSRFSDAKARSGNNHSEFAGGSGAAQETSRQAGKENAK